MCFLHFRHHKRKTKNIFNTVHHLYTFFGGLHKYTSKKQNSNSLSFDVDDYDVDDLFLLE